MTEELQVDQRKRVGTKEDRKSVTLTGIQVALLAACNKNSDEMCRQIGEIVDQQKQGLITKDEMARGVISRSQAIIELCVQMGGAVL